MNGRTTIITLLGLWLSLGGCTGGGDTGLDLDAPADVLEGGKADDYLGPISQEYDLVTEVTVTLTGDDAALEGEARAERARALGAEEMNRITTALDQKIWAEWTEDERTGDTSILFRQMSESIDGIRETEPGVYVFDYVAEVAGPRDLLERYPFGRDGASPFLEVVTGAGDTAHTYRLIVTVSEETPDSYPEYLEMFEDGLDIAVHIGDDHYTETNDIDQARSVYRALTGELGFESPVENFDALALGSGPFRRELDVDGRAVEVRVSLFHANMAPDDQLDQLVEAYRHSAATADVVIYSGHAGRTLTYSGVVLHYGPRASIPASEFRNLELPDKYQIFVFAGCETYTGYSESLFAHPGKTSANADVITTVNFSTSSTTDTATITLLGGLVDDGPGTWWPHSWEALLRQLNDADASSHWTAMYGVHGLSDNPRSSPLGVASTVGQSCQGNSDCPGVDSQCNRRESGELQCGIACTHDSGCPESSRCVDVVSNVVDELSQCIPQP